MMSAEPRKVTEEVTFCPSARCEEGAVLLGIVGTEGVVGYVTPRITIDSVFVHNARQGRLPEARFRFAQACVEGRCIQWTGSGCGLIDKVLASQAGAEIVVRSQGPLPRCVIRSTCRWFAQAGTEACAVCPSIIHSIGPRP